MGPPCSPWLPFQSGFALKSTDVFLESLNLERGTLRMCTEAKTGLRSCRQTPARCRGSVHPGPSCADCALLGGLTPALQQNQQKTFQRSSGTATWLGEEGLGWPPLLHGPGSFPGSDHPTPPSWLLCFSDEVTNWVRHPECWRHSIYCLYIPWGIRREVGDFPDPSYLPNGGERRAWMTG